MILSTSKVAYETTGSIMKLHSKRNRHLQSLHFSKEIVLCCYFWPLHLPDNLVEGVFRKYQNAFITKSRIKG